MNNKMISEQIAAKRVVAKNTKFNAGMGPDKPVIMLKRIGGTTYRVAVHFSQTSKETMNDKILRLIKNEAVGQ